MGVVTVNVHMRLALLAVIASVLVLASCVPAPALSTSSLPVITRTAWDCAEVVDDRLQSFPFDTNAPTARSWIRDHFELSAEGVNLELSADGTESMLRWEQSEGRIYRATILNTSHTTRSLFVSWSQLTAPTLSDLLRCLENPPLYRAYYAPTPDGDWTYLELWYAERGIVAEAFVTNKVSGMSLDVPLKHVIYSRPGPAEKLVTRFYRAEDCQPLHGQTSFGCLRPWPGDISRISIDARD